MNYPRNFKTFFISYVPKRALELCAAAIANSVCSMVWYTLDGS